MKKKLLLATLASMTFMPILSPVNPMSHQQIVSAQVQEGAQLVALGDTLNEQQAQETLQLLGAGQINPSNIVYVDGTMINNYLQDGSGPGTEVYSSAYIQGMPEGYGVQVQIVTPQNILQVSPLTYQNAAITAGARNVQIRVATVNPVTGEGALAGVYALLEQQGIALNQHDVQVAQSEITIVNEIAENESVEITDTQVNQMIADIKEEVVIEVTGNDNVVDNSTNITQIVNNITNNYGVANEDLIALLEQYAQEFAQTEAAHTQETIDSLNQSIQAEWVDVLSGLEGAVEPAELLANERADYSDIEVYHPILQAFSNELYRVMEAGEVVDSLYSDTFIFEAMTQDLSAEERSALNELRIVMYQYAANIDPLIASGELQPGFASIKEDWLNKINQFENMKTADPVMAEIISQMAIVSGRAPQVYTYYPVEQSGSVITFENVWNSPEGHQADFTQFTFDLADDTMMQLDYLTGELTALSGSYDFSGRYGVSVENLYIPTSEIPADYTIPGYVPEAEVVNDDVDENVEDTSEVEETEPTEPENIEEGTDTPVEDEMPIVEDPLEEEPENSEETEQEEVIDNGTGNE